MKFNEITKKFNLGHYTNENVVPSLILCEGSIKHPDCRLPLWYGGKQMEMREKVIDIFLLDEKCCKGCLVHLNDFPDNKLGPYCPHCKSKMIRDDEATEIAIMLQKQCYLCICEHPEVIPHIDKKIRRTLGMSRKVLMLTQKMSGT